MKSMLNVQPAILMTRDDLDTFFTTRSKLNRAEELGISLDSADVAESEEERQKIQRLEARLRKVFDTSAIQHVAQSFQEAVAIYRVGFSYGMESVFFDVESTRSQIKELSRLLALFNINTDFCSLVHGQKSESESDSNIPYLLLPVHYMEGSLWKQYVDVIFNNFKTLCDKQLPAFPSRYFSIDFRLWDNMNTHNWTGPVPWFMPKEIFLELFKSRKDGSQRATITKVTEMPLAKTPTEVVEALNNHLDSFFTAFPISSEKITCALLAASQSLFNSVNTPPKATSQQTTQPPKATSIPPKETTQPPQPPQQPTSIPPKATSQPQQPKLTELGVIQPAAPGECCHKCGEHFRKFKYVWEGTSLCGHCMEGK